MENQLIHMTQVGVVVKDLDKAIANMKRIFDVTPSSVGETRKEGRVYHQKPGNFMAKIALFDFCNIQFEFIQPLSGESIWKNFLDEHGEGLQHVSFRVADHGKARAQMQEAGTFPEMQGYAMFRPVRWDFYNTEDLLGFSVETSAEIPEETR